MPKKNIIWVVVILAATAATLWVTRSRPVGLSTSGQQPKNPVAALMEKIKSEYYTEIDDDTALKRGALRGMIEELDEFSSYFPPDQISAFQHRIDGFAEGLGLRTARVFSRVEVIDAAGNSPAHQKGLRPDMRLLMIDDIATDSMDDAQLRAALHPEVGDSVTLTLRTKRGALRTVSLTAQRYRVISVSGLLRMPSGQWQWMLDNNDRVAYIRISEFVNDTAERVDEALRVVGSIKGLVLDLRDNPGGKAEVAIQVADMFLRDGLIVKMVGRTGVQAVHEAHSTGTKPQIPTVVLVNEATASGAELLAGALWARHRAVLVGTRTRGKGCVQTMIDLGGMGLINLTTAQFVFDRSEPITRRKGAESWGLQPHVSTTMSRQMQSELQRLRIIAEFGPDERETVGLATQADTNERDALVNDILQVDRQLAKALELIRQRRVEPILADAAEKARQATTQASRRYEAPDSD